MLYFQYVLGNSFMKTAFQHEHGTGSPESLTFAPEAETCGSQRFLDCHIINLCHIVGKWFTKTSGPSMGCKINVRIFKGPAAEWIL